MCLQDKKQVLLPARPIYIFLHTSFLSMGKPDDGQMLTRFDSCNPHCTILLKREETNEREGRFSFTHTLFLLWMIKHAALGSSGRCTCRLVFDKAVTCAYFALRKKKCLCVLGCDVKNPSRTNALRRKAVLPLGAPILPPRVEHKGKQSIQAMNHHR